MTWRARGRQFAECIFLPLIAVSMPWPAAWRVLHWFARRGRFFGSETERALAMAAQRGFADDPGRWGIRHRLTRYVDQVDPALSWLRGDRWMDRHLVVDGDPLPAGPCVFAGFHYGTGFWTFRYLRHHGHTVSAIAWPVVAEEFPGEPVRHAFERWRMDRVARAGGAPVLYVGASVWKIRAALAAGTSVLGLIDVPQPTARSRVTADFMGAAARFPDGLVRIAQSKGVPLVAYLASLDPKTGRRHLTFKHLRPDAGNAMRALAAMLERAIRDDPAAWHLWANWPQFFDQPAAR